MEEGFGFSLKNMMAEAQTASDQRSQEFITQVPNPTGIGGPGYNIEAETSRQTMNPYYNATANQDRWASQGFPPGSEGPYLNGHQAAVKAEIAEAPDRPENQVSVKSLPTRRYNISAPSLLADKSGMLMAAVGVLVIGFVAFYFLMPDGAEKSIKRATSSARRQLPSFSDL